ncbi:hypothetical protein DIPPA_18792 [Diplonema papillatum]|nr:hypothetical protein DIPPA_18792 [Diplonema papillatum]
MPPLSAPQLAAGALEVWENLLRDGDVSRHRIERRGDHTVIRFDAEGGTFAAVFSTAGGGGADAFQGLVGDLPDDGGTALVSSSDGVLLLAARDEGGSSGTHTLLDFTFVPAPRSCILLITSSAAMDLWQDTTTGWARLSTFGLPTGTLDSEEYVLTATFSPFVSSCGDVDGSCVLGSVDLVTSSLRVLECSLRIEMRDNAASGEVSHVAIVEIPEAARCFMRARLAAGDECTHERDGEGESGGDGPLHRRLPSIAAFAGPSSPSPSAGRNASAAWQKPAEPSAASPTTSPHTVSPPASPPTSPNGPTRKALWLVCGRENTAFLLRWEASARAPALRGTEAAVNVASAAWCRSAGVGGCVASDGALVFVACRADGSVEREPGGAVVFTVLEGAAGAAGGAAIRPHTLPFDVPNGGSRSPPPEVFLSGSWTTGDVAVVVTPVSGSGSSPPQGAQPPMLWVLRPLRLWEVTTESQGYVSSSRVDNIPLTTPADCFVFADLTGQQGIPLPVPASSCASDRAYAERVVPIDEDFARVSDDALSTLTLATPTGACLSHAVAPTSLPEVSQLPEPLRGGCSLDALRQGGRGRAAGLLRSALQDTSGRAAAGSASFLSLAAGWASARTPLEVFAAAEALSRHAVLRPVPELNAETVAFTHPASPVCSAGRRGLSPVFSPLAASEPSNASPPHSPARRPGIGFVVTSPSNPAALHRLQTPRGSVLKHSPALAAPSATAPSTPSRLPELDEAHVATASGKSSERKVRFSSPKALHPASPSALNVSSTDDDERRRFPEQCRLDADQQGLLPTDAAGRISQFAVQPAMVYGKSAFLDDELITTMRGAIEAELEHWRQLEDGIARMTDPCAAEAQQRDSSPDLEGQSLHSSVDRLSDSYGAGTEVEDAAGTGPRVLGGSPSNCSNEYKGRANAQSTSPASRQSKAFSLPSEHDLVTALVNASLEGEELDAPPGVAGLFQRTLSIADAEQRPNTRHARIDTEKRELRKEQQRPEGSVDEADAFSRQRRCSGSEDRKRDKKGMQQVRRTLIEWSHAAAAGLDDLGLYVLALSDVQKRLLTARGGRYSCIVKVTPAPARVDSWSYQVSVPPALQSLLASRTLSEGLFEIFPLLYDGMPHVVPLLVLSLVGMHSHVLPWLSSTVLALVVAAATPLPSRLEHHASLQEVIKARGRTLALLTLWTGDMAGAVGHAVSFADYHFLNHLLNNLQPQNSLPYSPIAAHNASTFSLTHSDTCRAIFECVIRDPDNSLASFVYQPDATAGFLPSFLDELQPVNASDIESLKSRIWCGTINQSPYDPDPTGRPPVAPLPQLEALFESLPRDGKAPSPQSRSPSAVAEGRKSDVSFSPMPSNSSSALHFLYEEGEGPESFVCDIAEAYSQGTCTADDVDRAVLALLECLPKFGCDTGPLLRVLSDRPFNWTPQLASFTPPLDPSLAPALQALLSEITLYPSSPTTTASTTRTSKRHDDITQMLAGASNLLEEDDCDMLVPETSTNPLDVPLEDLLALFDLDS